MPLIGNNAGTVFPGGVDSFNAAYDPSIGPALQQLEGTEGFFPPNALSGIISQSVPDLFATSTVTLTAGSVFQTPLYLRAGQTVTNLSYYTATPEPPLRPTSGWASPSRLDFRGQRLPPSAWRSRRTVDGGSPGEHARSRPPCPRPTSCPTSGYYIAFVCVAATTGPNASAGVTMGTVGRGAFAPWPAGVADTSKTTPYTVGATVGATTAASASLLVYAN